MSSERYVYPYPGAPWSVTNVEGEALDVNVVSPVDEPAVNVNASQLDDLTSENGRLKTETVVTETVETFSRQLPYELENGRLKVCVEKLPATPVQVTVQPPQANSEQADIMRRSSEMKELLAYEAYMNNLNTSPRDLTTYSQMQTNSTGYELR